MPSSPLPTLAAANQLRARASRLRSLAHGLDTCALTQLSRRAGDDTWAGPTARVFREDLSVALHRIGAARDSLRSAAARLYAEADELERVVRATLVTPLGPR